jgi:hypothetical protein
MSVAGGQGSHELVVAEDGSIPAEQIRQLGVRPGAHLRVVAEQPPEAEGSIAGRLAGWPEVTWEDFERAGRLARTDLERS